MAIRIGLIGAGRAGREHLAELAGFPDVNVAAVCDADRTLAEETAAPYDAKVHINFRTLLESERLDAVFICVPPFSRGEPESAAARAGIHLFIERPVALNVEKARLIQKEIETAGIVAGVAYPWRYLSGLDRAREMLGDKRITLIIGSCQSEIPPEGWRRRMDSAGGQLTREATDLIDLARYLGGEMSSIAAVQHMGGLAARVPEYDIEDAVSAVISFRSGAIGQITSTDVSPRRENMLTMIADDLEIRITSEYMEAVRPDERLVVNHSEPGLRSCQRAFLEAVKSGNSKKMRCGYADAVRSLEIALAARTSAESGQVVRL